MASVVTGFARGILEKCGWREGQGLGKNETGIKEAIKVKLKMDSAGVGHVSGAQFSNQWWEHLYNTTADNISVTEGKDGVEIHRQDAKPHLTRKCRPSVQSGNLYTQFIKSGTMNSMGEIVKTADGHDCSSESEAELDGALRLTDEELVKLCEGRTAHKVARHGLRMSGKLGRLLKQEQVLSKTMETIADYRPTESDASYGRKRTKRSRKKLKRSREKSDRDGIESAPGHEAISKQQKLTVSMASRTLRESTNADAEEKVVVNGIIEEEIVNSNIAADCEQDQRVNKRKKKHRRTKKLKR